MCFSAWPLQEEAFPIPSFFTKMSEGENWTPAAPSPDTQSSASAYAVWQGEAQTEHGATPVLLADLSFHCFSFVWFGGRVRGNPGWPRTHLVAEDVLELLILLLPCPKCWGHRYLPPYLTCISWFSWFCFSSFVNIKYSQRNRPTNILRALYYLWGTFLSICTGAA